MMGDETGQQSRIAVAGFGNVLLGDDGFGVEVIKRLQTLALPVHVEAFEIGIGGMELVFNLMDGFNEMIVIDAVRRGNAPGTLYLFPPSDADLHLRKDDRVDPHLVEPTGAMRMARRLGILPDKIMVVGCEPESCPLRLGLSSPVRTAVDKAIDKIREMIGHALDASRTTV
jgi:hydrogenase maturation protease